MQAPEEYAVLWMVVETRMIGIYANAEDAQKAFAENPGERKVFRTKTESVQGKVKGKWPFPRG
jgi:hypothetical protein